MELIRDLWRYMRVRKRFWLLPVLLIALLLGALLSTAGTPLGPFIYTLF